MKTKMQCRSISRVARTAMASAFVILLAVVASPSAEAQTYSVLYDFTGQTDGNAPQGVIRDTEGNLYGTAGQGGLYNDNCLYGCGVLFKLDADLKFTVLHAFGRGRDGQGPKGGLVRDSEGNLYGTTVWGGQFLDEGYGTVFQIKATGKETVLYRFGGEPDGAYPQAGLVPDTAGNLYGTTLQGGVSGFGGTVFELNATNTETVLYSFTGGADGAAPSAALLRDSAGNLYGTALGGGDSDNGTVFELDANGKFTVLRRFTGGADGGKPLTGLIRDSEDNLYGTTSAGGSSTCEEQYSPGCGVVFKLDKSGKETVLHTFSGKDGEKPQAEVIRDSEGNFYGITVYGGDLSCNAPYGCGVVYKLAPSGKETVLYKFSGGRDGAFPTGLVRDTSGNLYGTGGGGGFTGGICASANLGCGVVFKLTP
jgi:uncharacterized repeat protein (TIGR03803 family)